MIKGCCNTHTCMIVFLLDEENQIFQEGGRQFKQLPNEDLNKEGCKYLFVVRCLVHTCLKKKKFLSF